MHLWLIGMMGVGKTRVGRMVAERARVPFHDTDDEVVARVGCSISELWRERGEAAFRDLETDTVVRLAAGPAAVIATGGGVVLEPRNVTAMRDSGLVVWLEASPRTLAERVGDGAGRPLLAATDPERRLADILRRRRRHYARAAHLRVSTDDRDPDEVAEEVWEAWTAS